MEAAVGGEAATQVVQGRKALRPGSPHEAGVSRERSPDRKPFGSDSRWQADPAQSQLANISQGNGASFIYRENNSRYIGIQYSIVGRDLAGAVNDAQRTVAQAVKLPEGYRMEWGGEYSEYLAAKSQISIVGPLTVVLIFLILFALYGNFKFPITIALGVVMTEPVGALIAPEADSYAV